MYPARSRLVKSWPYGWRFKRPLHAPETYRPCPAQGGRYDSRYTDTDGKSRYCSCWLPDLPSAEPVERGLHSMEVTLGPAVTLRQQLFERMTSTTYLRTRDLVSVRRTPAGAYSGTGPGTRGVHPRVRTSTGPGHRISVEGGGGYRNERDGRGPWLYTASPN